MDWFPIGIDHQSIEIYHLWPLRCVTRCSFNEVTTRQELWQGNSIVDPFLYADIFSKNIHKLYWNCMVVPLRCCFEPRSNYRTQSIYIYTPKLSWPTYKPTLLSKKSEDAPIYPSSLWPTLVTLHRRRGTGNTPWLCLRPWGRRRSTDLVSWSRGKLWFGGEKSRNVMTCPFGEVVDGWSWLKLAEVGWRTACFAKLIGVWNRRTIIQESIGFKIKAITESDHCRAWKVTFVSWIDLVWSGWRKYSWSRRDCIVLRLSDNTLFKPQQNQILWYCYLEYVSNI